MMSVKKIILAIMMISATFVANAATVIKELPYVINSPGDYVIDRQVTMNPCEGDYQSSRAYLVINNNNLSDTRPYNVQFNDVLLQPSLSHDGPYNCHVGLYVNNVRYLNVTGLNISGIIPVVDYVSEKGKHSSWTFTRATWDVNSGSSIYLEDKEVFFNKSWLVSSTTGEVPPDMYTTLQVKRGGIRFIDTVVEGLTVEVDDTGASYPSQVVRSYIKNSVLQLESKRLTPLYAAKLSNVTLKRPVQIHKGRVMGVSLASGTRIDNRTLHDINTGVDIRNGVSECLGDCFIEDSSGNYIPANPSNINKNKVFLPNWGMYMACGITDTTWANIHGEESLSVIGIWGSPCYKWAWETIQWIYDPNHQ